MIYIKFGFSILLFMIIFFGGIPTIMDEGIDITSIFVLIILLILLFILLKSTYYDFNNLEKAKLRRIKNKEIFEKQQEQKKLAFHKLQDNCNFLNDPIEKILLIKESQIKPYSNIAKKVLLVDKNTVYKLKNVDKLIVANLISDKDKITLKEIFSKEDKQNKIQNQPTHTATRQNRRLNQLNKDRAIQSLQLQAENFNRILTDVQCGYKNIDPYLSRYRILLEIYNDMEKLNDDFKLNALSYDSKMLYDTFSSELLKFIKSKILIVLDKHSIDDDNNKALLKDLKKVRNDIIEGKHEYPEFADLLQEIQFQIEEQIEKLS